MSGSEDITLSIKSINIPAGGGPLGIIVTGNGPVLINSVTDGSEADKAGIKMYDFIIKVNSTMVGSTGSDEVTSMLSSFRGLPITLMIARASPTPTKPTQRRRAILKLQSRLDAEPNIIPDDAAAARKEMGAAATSALAQLSSLDDILGVAPIRSPPKEQVVPSKTRSKERAPSSNKDQVVPNKDKLLPKETMDVSMLQSSKSTHEYEINFKDTFGDEPPPSSDEEDGPGDYDPLLDFSRDDDSFALQGGDSMTAVSVKSSDSARLRRGPSASNRGMLDDMRDAQQALKQFTEFTRDKLDSIDKQKKAKLEEEQQRAKPAVMMSQHSVELQPGVKKEKQPQPVSKPPPAQATTVKKKEDHFVTAPLYSEVKRSQQSAVSKPAAVVHKEETAIYQSVKKDKMAKVASNEYDELERPQKPYYVNQPHPLQSREPSLPTSPTNSDQLGSPPPTVPSYNPGMRDSFPLSNRPDYISKVITERFGSGDLGGKDVVEETTAQPYLTPARSKSPESPPPEETTKVVQKKVERKKSSEVVQKKKSSTSTSAPSMPVRQTSPPVKTGERKTSKGGPPPAQAASRVQRKSSSPEYKPTSGSMRPTSPGKSPDPLKGFSPMRPYEGIQSPPEQGKKQKGTTQSSTGSGGFKKLLRTISPKTKDQAWQLADMNTACKGLPLQIHGWQNQHVQQWLHQLSEEFYNKCHTKFQHHAITGHTLLRLNEDQLKLMGISDSKLRETLAGLIAKLKVRQAQIELSGLMKGGENTRPSRR
ncbi:nucleolar protein dao-5-like isoform X2 [Dysidea avara]|uniref:nucleolar protein dao-5-like isoform X2 n=1 Tax=Dysidea avara TaxID=196820 RepID=UPI00331EEB91